MKNQFLRFSESIQESSGIFSWLDKELYQQVLEVLEARWENGITGIAGGQESASRSR